MRDRPDGRELLEAARETLLEDLLKTVPAAHRYTALMIANAMAIAAREQEFGRKPLERELARLCRLFNESAPQHGGREALQRDLEERNRRLAHTIRGGRYDRLDESHQAVWDHLLETTREKLRESNPKYLNGRGLD